MSLVINEAGDAMNQSGRPSADQDEETEEAVEVEAGRALAAGSARRSQGKSGR